MGRPKGGSNRKWTVEEKMRIINRCLNEDTTRQQICKEENLSDSMLYKWLNQYAQNGSEGLINNYQGRGNHFSALHTSKNLTDVKEMKLRIAKLEVEVERLKKGYVVKGDGAEKEFVTTKGLNTK